MQRKEKQGHSCYKTVLLTILVEGAAGVSGAAALLAQLGLCSLSWSPCHDPHAGDLRAAQERDELHQHREVTALGTAFTSRVLRGVRGQPQSALQLPFSRRELLPYGAWRSCTNMLFFVEMAVKTDAKDELNE